MMIELDKLDPYRDEKDWVCEEPEHYAQRIKSEYLPNWPEEVLIEWLHRHARCLDRYGFLNFEKFRFERVIWPTENIPGAESFYDPKFLPCFTDIERRAREPFDWLAKYMLRNGTWNTPIVLLDNQVARHCFPSGELLKAPWHLLEGHRRLSFLNGLKIIGKAQSEHELWLVNIEQKSPHITTG